MHIAAQLYFIEQNEIIQIRERIKLKIKDMVLHQNYIISEYRIYEVN